MRSGGDSCKVGQMQGFLVVASGGHAGHFMYGMRGITGPANLLRSKNCLPRKVPVQLSNLVELAHRRWLIPCINDWQLRYVWQ